MVWGSSLYGLHDVPAPNLGFTALSAGTYHCLGLKADKTIVAWGSNLEPAGGYTGQPLTMTTNKRWPLMYDQAVLAPQMPGEVGGKINLQGGEWGLQLAHYNLSLINIS